ncbi:MAG: hypothetical protein JWM33_337 [Caulobacteraceae bacterium]|nr:hypothetical protein [Caulobacteraceae bacterium]
MSLDCQIMNFSAQFKDMVIRHRFTLRDLGCIALVVGLSAAFVWQADVFPNQTPGMRRTEFELDEVFAVLALAFALFSWSRLAAQRRETRRRIAAEQEARALAMEDPLTGLPNRRHFDEHLRAAIGAPPRSGACHAVLALDLNGFKKINDVYGHGCGDEVLASVAAILKLAVRDGDLVARLGGDEFAIVARHLAGPEAATSIARRIIDSLGAPLPTSSGEQRVGTAIGIALSPQDGADPEDLLRKADIALYRAKAERVSALRFFESEMDAQVKERDSLERELRAAIGTPALRPFYQPQIDLKSGRVVGFEALARWSHSTLGEIPPDRFIPIADDCGLIGPLTDSLLRTACRDAMTWPKDILLSVNISPIQLRDARLGLRLLAILGETGLSPHRLEIELTESALVADLEGAREVLGALRETGVKIALDDFGTGYSSLYHLRNFKLDKIKIDRSFIDSMTHDASSAAIVRALVGLGAGLSLTVTAEGVENADQQAFLAKAGCEQGQGFLYSRAVSGEDALGLLGVGKTKVRRA